MNINELKDKINGISKQDKIRLALLAGAIVVLIFVLASNRARSRTITASKKSTFTGSTVATRKASSRLKKEPKKESVGAGQVIGGKRVKEIGDNSVVIQDGDKEYTLKIGGFEYLENSQ